jgi:hypothetical protein
VPITDLFWASREVLPFWHECKSLQGNQGSLEFPKARVLLRVLLSRTGAGCLEHVFSHGCGGPLLLLECPQSDCKIHKIARPP